MDRRYEEIGIKVTSNIQGIVFERCFDFLSKALQAKINADLSNTLKRHEITIYNLVVHYLQALNAIS